ncbi:MAG: hypothetical protein ACQSGP_06930 [Frankia sp.]
MTHISRDRAILVPCCECGRPTFLSRIGLRTGEDGSLSLTPEDGDLLELAMAVHAKQHEPCQPCF